MYRETYDVRRGREVAAACGQRHETLVLDEEFLRGLPDHVERAVFISDGYLGLSGAAELYLNAGARRLAPVRLTGDYGGEVLRGDTAFKAEPVEGGFAAREMQGSLDEAREAFAEIRRKDHLTFALFHQAPFAGFGRLSIEQSYVVVRTPFMDNALVGLAYRAPREVLSGDDVSVATVRRCRPDLLAIPTDAGKLGTGSALRRAGRGAVHRVVVRAEYLAGHGMPGWVPAVFGSSLDPFLQRHLLGRNKFQHFRTWTATHLADYFQQVLTEDLRGLEGLVDPSALRRGVEEHLAGRRNYLRSLDRVLTLAVARRSLCGGEGFPRAAFS
jgi:asparagine synthase (glutamine-hydrolysing)